MCTPKSGNTRAYYLTYSVIHTITLAPENNLLNTPTYMVNLTCNNCLQLDQSILNNSCVLASQVLQCNKCCP